MLIARSASNLAVALQRRRTPDKLMIVPVGFRALNRQQNRGESEDLVRGFVPSGDHSLLATTRPGATRYPRRRSGGTCACNNSPRLDGGSLPITPIQVPRWLDCAVNSPNEMVKGTKLKELFAAPMMPFRNLIASPIV